MSELKPCPFCGGEAEFFKNVTWCVMCCHCKTLAPYGGVKTRMEAKNAWNTRPEAKPARVDWDKLHECLMNHEEDLLDHLEIMSFLKDTQSEWLLTEPKNTDRELLIKYTDSLRAYMRESSNNIGFDERESEEFVDIFLTEPNERNEK